MSARPVKRVVKAKPTIDVGLRRRRPTRMADDSKSP